MKSTNPDDELTGAEDFDEEPTAEESNDEEMLQEEPRQGEPTDTAGSEFENGPEVDFNDPNLSAAFAEAGAEDRKNALGMVDTEPFLDDPESIDE